MKTYYKVLCRDERNRLVSMGRVVCHPAHLIVIYKEKNEETVAPSNTKLFVFDSSHHARQFMLCFTNRALALELWEVEASEVIDICLVCSRPVLRYSTFQYWYRIWNNLPVGSFGTPAPIGTLACDSLILKKRVK